MNTLIRNSCLILVSATLVATGCSKKSETPAVPATSATPALATPAPGSTDGAAKVAADLAAAAKTKAEASAKLLDAEKNAAMKQAEAAAAEAKKQASEATAAAPPLPMPGGSSAPPPVVSGTGHADLAGAANLAASQASTRTDALKAQAEQLVAQYSGELATLKSNAVALKGLIDKHTNLLPAGVATKYQELNTLVPQLTSLVDTLKNYQTADLTSLVPKLKTDFTRAQTLYTEIKSMMP